MKLIITGHDYAGKSTILKELWKKYDNGKMSYIHLSYREPTNYRFYKSTLKYSNFLMDRCFLDELIYPEVFNRNQHLSIRGAKKLLKYCKDNDIVLIVLKCSGAEIKKRIVKRGGTEEKEVLDNINHIRALYIYYANEFGIPLVDTTDKSVADIIKEIETYIDNS